tara:strand:- start:15 stop:359 length:345 start_codon:yes stop_codon:yes gene_type:complete
MVKRVRNVDMAVGWSYSNDNLVSALSGIPPTYFGLNEAGLQTASPVPAFTPNPDKIVPSWPHDSAKQRITETHSMVDKRADKYMYYSAYEYHPHNAAKTEPQRVGKNVDIVVWG